MSQRKRTSATQRGLSQSQNHLDEALDDGDDATFTLPSSSQVVRELKQLPREQLDLKSAEVVQYILIKDQKKIPVRRADIVKAVIKEHRNIYPEIMKRATHTFEQVFGLKLLEIDTKNHIYILLNNLVPVEGELLSICPSNPKSGLLFVILSVIFMKGGVVKDTLVWNMLKKLRVDLGNRHETFGDVKKLVTEEFVRQKYLEYVKIPHTEPLEYEFRWGLRAEKEVSKMKLLEFVGQLHDQSPESWSQQYREAMTEATTNDVQS